MSKKPIVSGRPRSRSPKHLRTEVTYKEHDALKAHFKELKGDFRSLSRHVDRLTNLVVEKLSVRQKPVHR